ncbi:nuclear protein 96-domain-containing protein [Myxozyma melibiosi]|uniref:Nuclear protein 96-domain-containing protein n=1 Tax=Myxozyma melibiosi TaxID=54550 RepID=A0ABR1EZH4_9ASCO
MFGQSSGTGSAFGGFNNNNNNTNQQAPLFGSNTASTNPAFGSTTSTTGAFGQTSAFGSNTAPASGGLFGQNNNTNNQSSGFSGFGNAARPTFGAASTGFGGNATNTGGGLFGSTQTNTASTTSPFGGNSAFGSTNNTTSPFGQTNTTPSSGGLFGSAAAKPSSAFGGFGSTSTNTSPAAGFGGSFGSANGATNQGTALTPFQPLKEKEPTSNVTSVYQSISCMPAYQKYSFEELREQDYAQGRRYGNSTGAGAFGKPTGFGSGTFGQTNTGFGQTNNTPGGNGLFGNANNNSPSTTGGFGSTAFGANNTNNTNNTSGGLFGQKPATGGLFGSTNTGSTSGGMFGSNNTSNAFGATNNTTSAPAFGQTNTTGSAFGGGFGANNNNQPKPAFGATGTTGGFGGFGANNTASAAPAFGGSTATTFGAPAAGAAAGTGTGLFGNTNTNTGFGQTNTSTTPAFGGFGAANNNAAATSQPSTFGGFGATANNNNAAQTKPAFGGFGAGGFGSTTTNTTSTPMFGQSQNNQQKPAFGFGQTQPNQQQPAAGGLFGSNNTTQPSTGGLFGSANNTNNTSGGLFGANNNTQSSGGLFGAKPQTGGLFSAAQPQQNNGLFGGGGLNAAGGFGTQNNSSMFGNSQQQGNSMFGGSQFGGVGGQQQNPLQASIDQNPFGANPLFSSTSGPNQSSPGPIATPISNAAQKKKPALLPTYKLSPRPASSPRPKSANGRSASGSLSSGSGSNGSVMSKSLLFDGLADKAILSSDAFSPRNDIRKLVIDKRVTESELLTGGGDLGKFSATPSKEPKEVPKPRAVPEMKETTTNAPSLFAKAVSAPVEKKEEPATPNVTASTETPASSLAKPAATFDSPSFDNDGYWSYPSRLALRKMSLKELSEVADFQVGRKGYGEVSFSRPVDLSTFAHPEQIPGQYVIFGNKTCAVYPDDINKPEVGKGLNIPATITLENCWPIKKDTKEPILDPDHPAIPRHLQRLKSYAGTKFVTYMADKGTWVFTVEHFSVWGLVDDSGDEYDETDEPAEVKIPESNVQPMLQFPKAPQETALYGYSPMKTDTAPLATPLRNISEAMSSPAELDDSPSVARLPGGWNANSGMFSAQQPFLARGDTFKNSQPNIMADVRSTYHDEEEEQTSDEDKEEVHEEEEEGVPDETGSVIGPEDEDYDDYEGDEELVEPVHVEVGQDWIEQLKFAERPTSLWNEAEATRNAWLEDTKSSNRLGDDKFTFADLDSVIFGGDRFFDETEEAERRAKEEEAEAAEKNASKILFALSGKEIVPRSPVEVAIPSSGFDFLRIHLNNSVIRFREAGLPLFQPKPELTFVDVYEFYNRSLGSAEGVKNIWKLASILFDDVRMDAQLVSPSADHQIAAELIRKSMLSEFVERLAEKKVSDDLQRLPHEEAVFVLLSGHQIEQACIELVKDRNLHLATLVPLIGGDADFRRDIKNQINDWTMRQVLAHVPPAIRKIYELMSGNTSIASGSQGSTFAEDKVPEMCISKGLDWIRAFGLRLWYEIFEEDSIDKAVIAYESALKVSPEIASPLSGSSKTDTMYELLKLYADKSYAIESAVIPARPDGEALDLSVTWQLFNILFRVKSIRSVNEQTVTSGDGLCVDFAYQLESAGEWTFAIFVLLHIADVKICKTAVQDLLNRHVEDMDGAAESFLVDTLRVPKKMILTAKALYAHRADEPVQEARYLLDAAEWTQAHAVIIRTVGPRAIISEDYDSLLSLLSRFEDVTEIPGWNIGGQIYLDYIAVMKSQQVDIYDDDEDDENASENIEAWWPRQVRGIPVQDVSLEDSVDRLRSSLPMADTESLGFHAMVAVQEMAKIVGVDV